VIIRNVGFENFGLYQGDVVLDLTPASLRGIARPVVLIGGRNGVGKTTLLEAVRLALYGRRAIGTRVGQVQYEEYLRSRIHRPAASTPPPTGASVSLEFDFAEDGVVRRYRVRRSWQARGRTVAESLELTRDDEIVTDIPREEWHSFLQDLIPPGVSQLFFFDGERIQEIADGDHDEEHLASAIRGLLGVELVARLRTDLGLYLARHHRGTQSDASTCLESVLADLGGLDEQIATVAEELGKLSAAREAEGRTADQLRRRFVAEGGDLAARRTQLLQERDSLVDQINRRVTELRDTAGRLMPFTVAPSLTRRFRAAVRDADAFERAVQRPQIASAIQEAIRRWRRENIPTRTGEWSREQWRDLSAFFTAWATDGEVAARGIVNLASSDRAVLLGQLDDAESTVRPRLEALANDLTRLQERERELANLLQRADDGASSDVLDDLRRAEQRVGAAEATLQAREEELRQLRIRRAKLERDRESALTLQTQLAAAEHRAGLAAKASRALAEYERRLLERKVTQLRGEVVRCYNRLARKGDVLSDVRIDSETFAVALVDAAGREVSKSALSAGEKQIYAISVLWALARTSGRSLPMIVDTPLARLDTEHRANLVMRYFPEASHQVILLSTDTEVDRALLESLKDAVGRSWVLEYDSQSGGTIAREGYFWELTTIPSQGLISRSSPLRGLEQSIDVLQ
jgi:DNA sulfur modification protein DndD